MSQHLFTIKNDDEGKTLVRLLRKQFRNTPKYIRVRGRGHRKGIEKYRQDLPIQYAERLSIYIDDRPQNVWVKVVDMSDIRGYRWEVKPTKWHPSQRDKK